MKVNSIRPRHTKCEWPIFLIGRSLPLSVIANLLREHPGEIAAGKALNPNPAIGVGLIDGLPATRVLQSGKLGAHRFRYLDGSELTTVYEMEAMSDASVLRVLAFVKSTSRSLAQALVTVWAGPVLQVCMLLMSRHASA